ncbi:MAG: Pls/PosA family non-ribosomal peptide synthetase [Pseudomonadota bacterium]
MRALSKGELKRLAKRNTKKSHTNPFVQTAQNIKTSRSTGAVLRHRATTTQKSINKCPASSRGLVNTTPEQIKALADEKIECLHHIFEHQASIYPCRKALECADRSLSYSDVEALTNKMAHALREQGVKRGTFVGICLDRSEWSVISILATLKAGAAYVPIEPSLPDDRMRYISEQSEFTLIITDGNNDKRVSEVCEKPTVMLEDFQKSAQRYSSEKVAQDDQLAQSDDICYVLFTSGTTGRPKGVVTEHRNCVHFVNAFNEVCHTTQDDRIFQGFALGFDGSVEEMWMAFSNGATLVCGDKTTPRFGADLGQTLDELDITFFSTVPTLLSTLPQDLPKLRQLVVSGEACHPDIVERWAIPERVMLNVYGPTEATVNTTASRLERGKPVTIGRPLAGYNIHILDSDLKPVALGEKGELYVSGPSISRGYLKQQDLTSQTYINWKPDGHKEGKRVVSSDAVRLYKTGDLVRWNESGELEFFGRIDSQVKLRGFRIELTEIEQVLIERANISAVTVQVREHNSIKTLVAYVLLNENVKSLDRSATLAELRDKLPHYMVPSFLEVLEEFPRLASGKVDKKRLPEPKAPLIAEVQTSKDDLTDLEKAIASVWEKHFGIPNIGPEQDFFTDLGGHSLLAAQVASTLFNTLNEKISVRDIYVNPSIRQLADALELRKIEEENIDFDAAPKQLKPKRINAALPLSPAWVCSTITIQVIYFLTIIPVLMIPSIYILPLALQSLKQQSYLAELAILSGVLFFSTWLALIVMTIVAKWILIGKFRAGRYPMWGGFYIRWWVVSRLQQLSNLTAFNGTPLAPLIWRLMGAKVGRRCSLNASLVYAWDCIEIGDDVSIGVDTQLPGLRVESGYLIIGDIKIGSQCFIGNHSVLGLKVEMQKGARLDDQSFLSDYGVIPKRQSYRGSPAKPGEIPISEYQPYKPGIIRLTLFSIVQIFAGIVTAGVVLAPVFLAAWAIAVLVTHFSALIWLPAFVISVPLTLFIFTLWAAGCRKVVQPNVHLGVYKLYSRQYLQHWLSDVIMQLIKTVGLSIFTTLYLPPMMRLLGAELGRHTEMSTVWRVNPELLKAGDGVFFADGCMVGSSRIYQGRFELAMNEIGDRSFIGNSAILSAGNCVGNDCLLGVLSATPDQSKAIPDQTDWLGSPGFRLPNRQKVSCFSQELTYAPTKKLYYQRAIIDGLRVLLPGYILGVFAILSLLSTLALYEAYGLWAASTVLPMMTWFAMAFCIGSTVMLKWCIMGRFKPVVVPLWSQYVWWNELVNGVYECLMAPWIKNFYGTPFASVLLRLMGCKIGKYCYIETDLFSEFDLVNIGNHVSLNAGAVVQNHLFEDRIMKSSYVKVHDGCVIGNMSVILYDSVMQKDAVLSPMSLLMKGETMPKQCRWHGIPTSG